MVGSMVISGTWAMSSMELIVCWLSLLDLVDLQQCFFYQPTARKCTPSWSQYYFTFSASVCLCVHESGKPKQAATHDAYRATWEWLPRQLLSGSECLKAWLVFGYETSDLLPTPNSAQVTVARCKWRKICRTSIPGSQCTLRKELYLCTEIGKKTADGD